MSGRKGTSTAAITSVSKETAQMHFRISTSRPLRRRNLLASLTVAAALLTCAIGASAANAMFEDFAFQSASGSLSTQQAGAHADFETRFLFNGDPTRADFGQQTPWGEMRNVATELPPGLLGNPAAFPKCSAAVFAQQLSTLKFCPTDTQVGIISPGLSGFLDFPPGSGYRTPLYNLESPGGDTGVVARLGFVAVLYPMFIDIRLDPKRDNALTATLVDTPTVGGAVSGSYNTFWGVPTDASHDSERFNMAEAFICGGPCGPSVPSGLPPTPFMLSPTSCGPIELGTAAESYQRLQQFDFTFDPMADIEGCESVPFEPTLSLAPTTRSAAASSGVDVSLQVPQDGVTDPEGLASAHLKKAVVTLPEGVSLNPSAVDGLGSCTQQQIGVDRTERQIVSIGSNGTGVVLSFDGQTTPELPQLASAAAVQTALEGLPNLAPGDVIVSGRVGGPWSVDFTGALAGQDVSEIGGLHNELQQVAVRGSGGAYTLGYDGETTGSLDFDADAAEVEAALEALPGLEPDELEVQGGLGTTDNFGTFGRVFRVAFTGTADVPQITTPTSSLVGNGAFNKSFTGVVDLVTGGSAVSTHTVKQGGTIGFDGEKPTCPESSKVGTGQITTPVFEEPLQASLYVAQQNDNPFDSLIAGYLVAKGNGALLKVAGKFDLDPASGRIVATFDNNPQQPFDELELHFKGGNRGLVTTPSACGTYQSKYELTPWSGNPPVVGTSEFTLDQNCASQGFAPGFSAGSSNPLAGAFTSFAVRVTRNPGSPQLTGVAVDPPLGLTGKLAGIPYCSEAALATVPTALGTGAGQLAAPACPAASQIGSVIAGAGSGQPFYLRTGKAYLAGPYRGAPLSMAILTPAVAGPFDLGNVLVRTAIAIDPATAQLHATSDPLPTILQGVPLELRDVRVSLDRPGFALNPTSCEPKSVHGTVSGAGGASAEVSDRFQVGECAALGFKPKMALRLKGGTSRSDHPALTAVLRARPGDANISRVSVAFPSAEFLDQSHIGTVCTRVQWAADACPAASVYGKVSATTPLLDSPLTGKVYLRSSNNKLPDLVVDLRGPAHQPVRFEAAGRTDTVRGGLRNTFDFVPDAPLSKVLVQLKGGKKGLLENSRDLCALSYRATVNFTAHNGRTYTAHPKLQADCAKARQAKPSRGR